MGMCAFSKQILSLTNMWGRINEGSFFFPSFIRFTVLDIVAQGYTMTLIFFGYSNREKKVTEVNRVCFSGHDKLFDEKKKKRRNHEDYVILI